MKLIWICTGGSSKRARKGLTKLLANCCKINTKGTGDGRHLVELLSTQRGAVVGKESCVQACSEEEPARSHTALKHL